ncbi:YggL family protein [Acidovorax sp. SDU_ACID1]|uniref:YggL family protein n=1 Tax=Acidovorax sp. SDU_ACID1 TaxID=3136632 RepID=UPI0038736701
MTQPPSQRQLSRWNRRQRKKHHAGEFQELGFAYGLRLAQPLDPARLDALMDAAIEMFEANGLEVGGGWAPQSASGFVSAAKGSVTEAQRMAVLAWLQAWPGITHARVGGLQDAWYGEFDDFDEDRSD